MLRYIKVKNFRTFTDFEFNLIHQNNVPLKLAIIYGENGSGKSSIISVLDVLQDTFQTMNLREKVMKMLENRSETNPYNNPDFLKSFTDISKIISTNKTVDSTENMYIEIGFQINGKDGMYSIEFDSESIVYEKLEYTLEKNKGIYFEMSPEKTKVNQKLFKEVKNDLFDLLRRYWGKHSVISLLNNIMSSYNDDYKNMISNSLKNVLDYLNCICIYMADPEHQGGSLASSVNISPAYYAGGIMNVSDTDELDRLENQLNSYYTSIYKNIKKVYYRKEPIDEKTFKYSLYFSKTISGQDREIAFAQESCGTKHLLYLFPFCMSAAKGCVVCIDEIDNGIHDVLLAKLLKSLNKSIIGQLIVTTHNTLLLNEYDFKDSFFFIEVDEAGNRTIKTTSDFNYRVQPESNVMLNYLQNKFHGLPWTDMDINFESIMQEGVCTVEE